MADEKKRWTPGKLSFADIKPDPPPIRKFFKPGSSEHIRFQPPLGLEDIYQSRFKDVSMGCKAPEPECPLCEAGVPTREYKPFNIDCAQLELRIVAQMLAEKGFKLESQQGRTLVPMPQMHTHDNAVYQVPEEGERIVGIDFGDDGRSVLVMGVVKRCGEPNKNGDVFILEDMKVMDLPPGQTFKFSEPEYVGKFPGARKLLETGPQVKIKHVNKFVQLPTTKADLERAPKETMNKVADRIKTMTEQYISTYQGDPHHVSQTRDMQFERENPLKDIRDTRFDNEYLCQPLDPGDEPGPMKIPKLDEHSPIEKIRWVLEGIMERQEWLANSPNAPKLIEARELSREQYTLYRAQQRVEALLHRKEAEMIDEELADIYADECQAEVAEEQGKQVECPRCLSDMVLREAGRGLMQGHKFYGCSNYPHCDATRTINEVKEEFPKNWKVEAQIVKGETQKRLQFAVVYGLSYRDTRRTPLMGKRFPKAHLTGNKVFYGFIEPAARAAGSTIENMTRELLKALGVKNIGVVAKRMVVEEGCDDNMLDRVLKDTKLVQKFLGIESPRKLFRIVVERHSYKIGKADAIQFRAKDRKGQTIKSSHMPWDNVDDPHAMETLITEFCHAVAEELTLGSGDMDGAQQVLDCLQESTGHARVSASKIKHAVQAVHQVAMSLVFSPSKKMKTKCRPPGRIKHGALNSVLLSIGHPGTERQNREIELTAHGAMGTGDYFMCSIESIRLANRDRYDIDNDVKDFLTNFSTKTARKFAVSPTAVLKLVLEEIRRSAPSVLLLGEQQVLERVCLDLLGAQPKKGRTLQEIAERAYSPQTEEFIEEQKRLAPQKEQERLERLHKAEEDARKLDARTKMYPAGYCKKCDKTGCMCPRPPAETHPLHTCAENKHVRVRPIPLPQQNDLGLHKGEWSYCLDCFAIVDYNGVASGRKISNLDAPQDS